MCSSEYIHLYAFRLVKQQDSFSVFPRSGGACVCDGGDGESGCDCRTTWPVFRMMTSRWRRRFPVLCRPERRPLMRRGLPSHREIDAPCFRLRRIHFRNLKVRPTLFRTSRLCCDGGWCYDVCCDPRGSGCDRCDGCYSCCCVGALSNGAICE